MKMVLQRVTEASVAVDGEVIGDIGRGLLVFVGAEAEDDEQVCRQLVDKMAKLRIFADDEGKSNLSVTDIGGEVLIISQFTLCADTKKGNRPSFMQAAPPDVASALYDYFCDYCIGKFSKVAKGSFGADMKVSLINDGPYTIIITS